MSTTSEPTSSGFDMSRTDLGISMPMLGAKIGQNRILSLIAEGGMASVYKTWHEGLEVVRAIKILKPGFSSEARDRLQTEAKISANLHHPNIVEIYMVDFWEGTTPYIEMEYIDGFSVKELLEAHKRLPATVAISTAYFVCKALQFAHNQHYTLYGKEYAGLVHRDIKPANILVSRSGRIKLADFGIAKPLDVSLHTVGTKVMGTFAYLSPEQLNGEGLDARCDLYALGAVVYEMLSGKKAFPQPTLAELVHKKTKGQYLPIEGFDLGLPRQLNAMIDKCMCLDRQKRFTSAAQLGKDLFIVLKKISSAQPQEIITSYMKNPVSAENLKPPVSRQNARIRLILLLVAGAIVAAGLLFAVKYFLPGPSFHGAMNTPVRIAPTPAVKTPPAAPAPADTPQLTVVNTPVPQALPEKPARPKPKPATAAPAAKPAQADRTIPKIDRTETTLIMINAWLQSGDCARADSAMAGLLSTDGYYYLLKAQLLMRHDKYSEAIEVLKIAQDHPSQYVKNVSGQAVFLWAQCLEAQYLRKPNLENRRSYERAYQKYLDGFCPGAPAGDANCSMARQKAARQ
jgi:serine/threonine protein kinase